MTGTTSTTGTGPGGADGRGQVLVVDDDDAIRRSLTRALRLRGFTVAAADGGAAALRLLGGPAAPDVLVLDISMPGIDGTEVCRTLHTGGAGARALCKPLPTVDAHIDRALARLNGPVTERGSIARLQKRIDNADAKGDTAVSTFLKDRLTFRQSLLPGLNKRSTDLDAVRTWCGTQHFPAKGAPKAAKGAGK